MKVDVCLASGYQVHESIVHEKVQGQCSETAHRARWDQLKWWKVHLGAPLVVEDWMRPAREQAGEGVTQGQAIAADNILRRKA